jgi:hypothetical protein
MTTGKAKQSKPVKKTKQPEKKEKNIVVIVRAIIGGIFVIAGVLITIYFTPRDITVILRDGENKKKILGRIYIDNKPKAYVTDPDELQVTVELRRGRHIIEAESNGYLPKTEKIEQLEKHINISLERAGEELVPLSLVGWYPFRKDITITRGDQDNECIINSASRVTSGFTNESVTVLNGKTLVLYFSNTKESDFDGERMVKLAYNQDDKTLGSSNVSLLEREYLPRGNTAPDRGIEFPIPDDFDGKLGFVFYQAELRDLKISAYYK